MFSDNYYIIYVHIHALHYRFDTDILYRLMALKNDSSATRKRQDIMLTQGSFTPNVQSMQGHATHSHHHHHHHHDETAHEVLLSLTRSSSIPRIEKTASPSGGSDGGERDVKDTLSLLLEASNQRSEDNLTDR